MHRSFREQHDVLGDLDDALVGAGQQLPGTRETLALVEGAQRQDGLPPGMAPTHPRAFHPLDREGLARGFDDP